MFDKLSPSVLVSERNKDNKVFKECCSVIKSFSEKQMECCCTNVQFISHALKNVLAYSVPDLKTV
ncbi:MAG: hypothetical protein JJU01_02565 [Alkalibacterium sp.]|nr:hypothetical protein [Alkalibacterium sp.]